MFRGWIFLVISCWIMLFRWFFLVILSGFWLLVYSVINVEMFGVRIGVSVFRFLEMEFFCIRMVMFLVSFFRVFFVLVVL